MKLSSTPLHLMSASSARAHLRVARKIKGHYVMALNCGKNPGRLHDTCNSSAAGDLLLGESIKDWNWSVIEAEARAGITEELRTCPRLNAMLTEIRAKEAEVNNLIAAHAESK